MINYGLENRVAIITGANNPWGIGATTALAFAREGAKVVLVYKKVDRPFDPAKTGANGVDRYYAANAGDAAAVVLLGYDGQVAKLEAVYDRYEAQYGEIFELSAQEIAEMDEEARANYDTAIEAFSADTEASHLYSMLINLTLIMITFGILLSYLVLELLVPLLLGNGQTAGKKVFGIGVMRADGVKISPLLLFVRTVLGKYTVETMIPVMMLLMIFFGTVGIGGTAVVLLLGAVQLLLIAVRNGRTPIHDLLAQTVTVDLASQRIFESVEAKTAYLAAQESNGNGSDIS